jgi:hypothetical protein
LLGERRLPRRVHRRVPLEPARVTAALKAMHA